MLIAFLRVLFVCLAVLVGMSAGRGLYDQVMDGVPVWFGGVMGFAIAITLIAAEQAFRRHFTRSLVALLLGLTAGLALAWLTLSVLGLALADQPSLLRQIDVPVALIITYLAVITVVRNADRFRVVLPFVEFRAERRDAGVLILAPDLPADGRLVPLLRAGITAERVVVHARVAGHWEAQTGADDAVTAARARRAVEGLAELRQVPGLVVDLDATEIPGTADLIDLSIRLARLETGRLATADRDTARRAAAQGIPVVDLAVLAGALAPVIRPGDRIEVLIARPGDSKGQGVGHLDDGSLVVVTGAADAVGQTVACVVLRLHATGNGRMVFAERA
jgi:uncharacterized protein YacL